MTTARTAELLRYMARHATPVMITADEHGRIASATPSLPALVALLAERGPDHGTLRERLEAAAGVRHPSVGGRLSVRVVSEVLA